MLGNNGVLIVNTADGTFLKAGTSITRTSSTGHTVTINNNVLKGNISVLGNPFNLNINTNQSAVGTLTLTSGTLNLALGSSVSSLAFAIIIHQIGVQEQLWLRALWIILFRLLSILRV